MLVEADMLRAVADVNANECNALVVFLGNFGPETPETLIARNFDGPCMFVAAAEGDGDLINGRGDAYCGMLNCSYNLGMRSIPGMVVMSPADDVEAKAMVKAAYEHDGPVYMRFSRFGAPVIHDPDSFKFEIGRAEVLREGTDVALIANGLLVAEALAAADILAEKGISARVIDMATVKPLDEAAVLRAAKDCGKIVTCEEHSIIGGLGEAVCAVIAEHGIPCPVKRVGVNDEFGHSGPAGELLKQFGLCAANLVKVANEV